MASFVEIPFENRNFDNGDAVVKNTHLFFVPLAIFCGRTSDVLLEIFAKETLSGKVKAVGYLLDRHLRTQETIFGFRNHIVGNDVTGITSARLTDARREMLGRDAQLVCIKLNLAVFLEINRNKRKEAF